MQMCTLDINYIKQQAQIKESAHTSFETPENIVHGFGKKMFGKYGAIYFYYNKQGEFQRVVYSSHMVKMYMKKKIEEILGTEKKEVVGRFRVLMNLNLLFIGEVCDIIG